MSSLLDSLKEQTTPDVIRGLASSLGESGDAVQKGLLGGATTILATLASKAQEPGFLSQIMNLISGFTTRSARWELQRVADRPPLRARRKPAPAS